MKACVKMNLSPYMHVRMKMSILVNYLFGCDSREKSDEEVYGKDDDCSSSRRNLRP